MTAIASLAQLNVALKSFGRDRITNFCDNNPVILRRVVGPVLSASDFIFV